MLVVAKPVTWTLDPKRSRKTGSIDIMIYSVASESPKGLLLMAAANSSPCLFSAPEIFFQTHLKRKTGAGHQSQKSTVDLWRRFLAHV